MQALAADVEESTLTAPINVWTSILPPQHRLDLVDGFADVQPDEFMICLDLDSYAADVLDTVREAADYTLGALKPDGAVIDFRQS